MARKQKFVTCDHDGRDKGKVFCLTEMPASRAEKWAARALFAMGKAGFDVPDEIAGMGMAAVAVYGLRGVMSVDFGDAEPLMDEMMACVQYVPDPGSRDIMRALYDDDIDEVKTLAFLRGEIIELHTGFSIAAAISSIPAAIAPTDAPALNT